MAKVNYCFFKKYYCLRGCLLWLMRRALVSYNALPHILSEDTESFTGIKFKDGQRNVIYMEFGFLRSHTA